MIRAAIEYSLMAILLAALIFGQAALGTNIPTEVPPCPPEYRDGLKP